MPGTWLLDADVGGRRLRYATRDVTVYDADGVAHEYLRGLSDFALRLDGMETQAGVEIVDRQVNWALLAARGDGIDRQPAILRYWAEGQALEQARVVVDGILFEPEYGAPDNPYALVATVRDPSSEVLFPPVSAVIDESTFTYEEDVQVFSDLVRGAIYPTIFGFPGSGDDTFLPMAATPAMLVSFDFNWPGTADSYLLIARGEVDAQQVVVHAPDMRDLFGTAVTPGSAFYEFRDVFTVTDNLGQVFSAVGFNSSPNDPITDFAPWELWPHPDQRYYVGWRSGAGEGGGALLPDRSGPIRNLTDVAVFVLQNSGVRVDIQAQAAEGNRLDRFKIDGVLNQRLGLIQWFEEQLVRLFPIVRARTSRGIYWRFVNWQATPVDAVARLSTLTRQVTRASGIRSTGQIANVFSLDYQLVGATGLYRKRATLSHRFSVTPLGGIDERVTAAPILARSFAKYQEIEAPPVQCMWTWTDATAGLILAYWAHRDGLPRRFVEYTGPDLHTLSRGDIVTITDPEIGLADAVAVVDAVTLSSGRLHRLALEVIDLQFRSTV